MIVIENYSRTLIYMTNLWVDWYLPKFTIYMEVEEPYLHLYWFAGQQGTDKQYKVIDYNDVGGYGYVNPTSATDLMNTIQAYIDSAWVDIGPGGELLTAKADLLSNNGTTDEILAGGANEYILSRDDSTSTGLKWISKTAVAGTLVEVATTSINSATNNYAISGATPSANVVTILRVTPTASFKFTGIDTSSWGNGKRLVIENVTDPLAAGARIIIIERNSASSSAANRFNYSAENMPIIIAPGQKITFEYNTTTSLLEVVTLIEPNSFFTVYSDCYVTAPFTTNNGGAASSVAISTFLTNDTTYKNQGVQACNTGTTTTGRAFISTGINALMFGYGSFISLARVGINNLSDATDEYTLLAGFCDNNAAVVPTDAVAWQYDRTQSTDFITITCNNNTPTRTTITGLTPTINQMIYLGTFLNGDATNAEFFYSTDGEVWEFTSTPHTTNIPSGTARLVGFQVGGVKSAGTTSRQVQVDSLGFKSIMKRGA